MCIELGDYLRQHDVPGIERVDTDQGGGGVTGWTLQPVHEHVEQTAVDDLDRYCGIMAD